MYVISFDMVAVISYSFVLGIHNARFIHLEEIRVSFISFCYSVKEILGFGMLSVVGMNNIQILKHHGKVFFP